MTRIAAVHAVLPPHRYSQREITEAFSRICLPDRHSRALGSRLHTGARVATRHLALPLEAYASLTDFSTANDAFVTVATDLGTRAVAGALDDAGLRPQDVDLLISATVTGLAVPSLDARIALRLGMRPDVRRVPTVGLGCMAGAAGIARIHDLLGGIPCGVGVLVCTELCSLTLQHDDPSVANIVASGLFGDGAAAVVAVGGDRASDQHGPAVLGSRSHLYPGTERAMGWDIGTTGFKVVLGPEVPELVEAYLRDDVQDLLAEHDLKIDDIDRWISHPGGPKVIDAIRATLGLDDSALALTWRSLHTVGNMSSVSVLHVLRDTLAERPGEPGDRGVVMAMGPGFASELVLLGW